MIDERLRAYGHAGILARKARATAAADALGGIENVAQTVARWWSADASSVDRLEAELSTVGVAEQKPLIDAVLRLVRGTGGQSELDDAATIAVARGIGRGLVTRNPSQEAFDASVKFCQYHWHDFLDTFVSELRARDDVRQLWVNLLRKVPQDIEAYLPDSRDKVQLTRALREREDRYRLRRLGIEAWERVPDLTWIDERIETNVGALLRIDPKAGALALADVPSHVLRATLLQRARIEDDGDLILDAIRGAGLAYKNGKWTTDTTLQLLLQVVLRRLQRIYDLVRPTDNQRGPLDRELNAFVASVIAGLLERRDGRRMAAEFCAELVRKTRHVRSNSSQWSTDPMVLNTVASALSQVPYTASDFREAWAENSALKVKGLAPDADVDANRLSAIPYLVASCMAVPRADAALQCSRDQWDWYADQLTAADPDLRGDVNPFGGSDHFVFAMIGRSLADLSNPMEDWSSAWSSLFRQRDQANYLYQFDLLAPSLHLLRVARVAAAVVAERDSSHGAELWRAVYRSARTMVFGGPSGPYHVTREVGTLFAFVANVFREKWPDAIHDASDDLSASEPLRAIAGYFLVQNGVEKAAVVRVFADAGCDLNAAHTDLLTWKKAEGHGLEYDGIPIDVMAGAFS